MDLDELIGGGETRKVKIDLYGTVRKDEPNTYNASNVNRGKVIGKKWSPILVLKTVLSEFQIANFEDENPNLDLTARRR